MTTTAEQEFWRWFESHDQELFDFERDQERVFDKLSAQLCRVHPDLTFEFGPISRCRELVISAGGLQRAFPAVSSLVTAAPKMEQWRITAFRPRRATLNRIEIADQRLNPADVEFSLLTNGSQIGLQVYIPGLRENDTIMKQLGYLMLDEALGEFDVETGVGLIQFLPSESPRIHTRYPIVDLATLFDQLRSRLTGAKPPN